MAHDKVLRLAVVVTTKMIDTARKAIAEQEGDAGMRNRGTMTDDEVAQWCVLDVTQKHCAKEHAVEDAKGAAGFMERVRSMAPGAYPRVKK